MVESVRAKKEILFIFFITVVMLYLYGGIDYRAEPYKNLDLRYYLQMARVSPSIAVDIPRPFCFRLLGPYIAGLLPIDEALAFRILTYLSLLILVVIFYRFLLACGLHLKLTSWVTGWQWSEAELPPVQCPVRRSSCTRSTLNPRPFCC